MKQPRELFSGCTAAYDRAKTVLIGVPFDSVGCARTGAGFAPDAIRRAGRELEPYSFYQDRDLRECAVCDLGDTEGPRSSPEAMLETVEAETRRVLSDGKIPVLLGGPPLLTLGSIRALSRQYPRLHMIRFGAHADLQAPRADLPSRSVVRQCYELLGEGRVHQFCVRSGSREEFRFADRHTELHALGFEWLQPALDRIRSGNLPLYLSLNLDCLDPSLFPAAEHPCADGVTFSQLIEAVRRVCGGRLVGADVTGLVPAFDSTGASACIASQVLRELLCAAGGGSPLTMRTGLVCNR